MLEFEFSHIFRIVYYDLIIKNSISITTPRFCHAVIIDLTTFYYFSSKFARINFT